MPYRKTVFANGEVYHVLNRSIGKIPIFRSKRECERFLNLIDYYRFEGLMSFSHYKRLSGEEKKIKAMEARKKYPVLVEILAFCLLPSHFHFLLKQQKEKGISKMIADIQNAYAKFFNLRRVRKGPLFESIFKAVRIESNEQLLHVSRYIHLNPSTAYLVKIRDLTSYQWSSLPEYLGARQSSFVNPGPILKSIGGAEDYKKFVLDQAEYQRDLARIKHLALED